MLICVGGRGYYQEWGKEAVEMTPGKVINIPAEVKHWHGAAPDSWFSHLALEIAGEDTSTEWCEPVSDEDYSKLKLVIRRQSTGFAALLTSRDLCDRINKTISGQRCAV